MNDSDFPPWWAVAIFASVLLGFALFLRKQDAGWFERLLSNDRSARCFGLCSVLFGSFVAWILVWSPMADALTQRRSLSIYRGSVAVPSIFIVVGLITLWAGRRSNNFVLTRHGQSPSDLQKKTTGIGVAVCVLSEVAFHFALYKLGYSPRW